MSYTEKKAEASLANLALWLLLATTSVVPFRAAAQTTTVWDWGFNAYGQLGNSTLADSAVATSTAPAINSVIAVAGGGFHSLALQKVGSSSSTIWAWGDNVFGQLGDGSFTPSNEPVQVESSTWSSYGDVIEIAAGAVHSLAVTSNSSTSTTHGFTTVWAWGSNDFGQLGNGSSTNIIPDVNPSPKAVVDPSGVGDFPSNASTTVTGIAAGKWHSLALTLENGTTTVWAWGNNEFGQLGIGGNTSTSTPVEVEGALLGLDVVAIAAGDRHSLALTAENGTTTVWAWGNNDFGQLGIGGTNGTSTPAQVLNLPNDVIAIAAGAFHSLALTSNGDIYAWGDNAYGQLGNNTTDSELTPVLISSPLNVKRIAAGTEASLALTDNGSSTELWAWGYYWGPSSSLVPVQVNVPAGYNVKNGTSTIEGGDHHNLAIFSELETYCLTTITTDLSTTSTPFGESVLDTATVTSDPGCANSTGTVTFYYQANSTSTSGWIELSTGSLSSSGTSTSSDFASVDPHPGPGTYYFKAVYSGDSEHGGSESTIEERLEYKRETTIMTKLSARFITHNTDSVKDMVAISTTGSGPSATGTWQLEVSQDALSWTPVGSGQVSGPLWPNPLVFTTPLFGSTLTPGLWFIRVKYSGDSSYSPSQSGDWSELLIVL
jgi:alpha-tubulin suppressor-like RCC1 family protein